MKQWYQRRVLFFFFFFFFDRFRKPDQLPQHPSPIWGVSATTLTGGNSTQFNSQNRFQPTRPSPAQPQTGGDLVFLPRVQPLTNINPPQAPDCSVQSILVAPQQAPPDPPHHSLQNILVVPQQAPDLPTPSFGPYGRSVQASPTIPGLSAEVETAEDTYMRTKQIVLEAFSRTQVKIYE
eukprot:TRINITY_DN5500_c0_g1_i6.p1 TRINITY_DN5500_c0_g1~~TRINITY_DN5500_c0_g1_i6.p1  ORF type:complete len:179 (-),score=33.63 TRINITY_DN5500_c0_g1_i6:614-1150(-)